MVSLQGRTLIQPFLAPVSVTSDEVAGSYVDYNGYGRALIAVQGGLVSGGDSDDTVSFQVLKSTVAAASADSDDETAITGAVTVIGPSATTDVALGMEFIDIDLPVHGLSTGCLIVRATGSEGATVISSATIMLYKGSSKRTDTAMTIVTPASS